MDSFQILVVASLQRISVFVINVGPYLNRILNIQCGQNVQTFFVFFNYFILFFLALVDEIVVCRPSIVLQCRNYL